MLPAGSSPPQLDGNAALIAQVERDIQNILDRTQPPLSSETIERCLGVLDPLIRMLAHRFHKRLRVFGTEYEDIYSHTLISAYDAIRRYDRARGAFYPYLRTVAMRSVRNNVLQEAGVSRDASKEVYRRLQSGDQVEDLPAHLRTVYFLQCPTPLEGEDYEDPHDYLEELLKELDLEDLRHGIPDPLWRSILDFVDGIPKHRYCRQRALREIVAQLESLSELDAPFRTQIIKALTEIQPK